MANDIKNILKMDGIRNLHLFTEEDGVSCLDFNKIIPMPESLNIESGSMTERCVVYFLTERCTIPIQCLESEKKEIINKLVCNQFYNSWAEEVFRRVMVDMYSKSLGAKNKAYEQGRTYVQNYQRYGAATWHGWRCDNWGTKWNAYANEQIDEDTISFKTAWSAPDPVISKLSEMYPNVVIEHWYADEDMGCNTGYRKYCNGVLVDSIEYEKLSNDAYENYIRCWGPSNCLYKDSDGNWDRKECDECGMC